MKNFTALFLSLALMTPTLQAEDFFSGLTLTQEALPASSVQTEALLPAPSSSALDEIRILRQGFFLEGILEETTPQPSDPSTTTTSLDSLIQKLRHQFDETTASLYTGGTRQAEAILTQNLLLDQKKEGEPALVKGTVQCRPEDGQENMYVPGGYHCSYTRKDSAGQEENSRVLVCINEESDIVCHQSLREDENTQPQAREIPTAPEFLATDSSAIRQEYLRLRAIFDQTLGQIYTGGREMANALFYDTFARKMARKGNELEEDSISCQRLKGGEIPLVAGDYECEYSYLDEDDQTHTAKDRIQIDLSARVTRLETAQ